MARRFDLPARRTIDVDSIRGVMNPASSPLGATRGLLVVLCLAIGLCPSANAASPATRGATAQASPDWWGRVQRQIVDSEYEISWQPGAGLRGESATWQAPNRAHGFRTHFTSRGIRLVPRVSGGPGWEWRLSTIGLGRAGAMQAIGPAELFPLGNRIELDRPLPPQLIPDQVIRDGIACSGAAAKKPPEKDPPPSLDLQAGGEKNRISSSRNANKSA